MTIAKNHRKLGIIAAATIFILDQITKYAVIYPLALQSRQTIEILPFFNLTFVRNYGVSMGFLRADTEMMRWALVGLTLAIAVFVAVWMWREKARDDVLGLGMVLGGALGNIVDRVRFGYVIDFADLHIGNWRPFLVFNIADAAITIGVLILLARALLLRDKGEKVEKRNA
ncbi:signal peptidase II [Rhizorhapis sp. SPR117]|uniref:signal peptidase II n=1 Tax=Rhizorhapis sp. SPR117 TaxID=2912611 RepID=UPI001EFFEBA7|nr:signal peptidase II [Rhizorhapis sp. SPR117]